MLNFVPLPRMCSAKCMRLPYSPVKDGAFGLATPRHDSNPVTTACRQSSVALLGSASNCAAPLPKVVVPLSSAVIAFVSHGAKFGEPNAFGARVGMTWMVIGPAGGATIAAEASEPAPAVTAAAAAASVRNDRLESVENCKRNSLR